MKLSELNEMMLNPISIIKCKKLKKESDQFSNMMGNVTDAEGRERLQAKMDKNREAKEKLGCE